MPKLLISSLVFIISSTFAAAQTPLPPALYVDAEDIAAALAKAASERPAMAVSTITTTDQYRINLIRRTEAAGAIIHEIGTELHYITEGSAILVTGGIVIRDAEGSRRTIEGGLARRVTAGDAILIPEGTPHWYSAVDGSVTYLEVRFNVPAAAE